MASPEMQFLFTILYYTIPTYKPTYKVIFYYIFIFCMNIFAFLLYIAMHLVKTIRPKDILLSDI